jgi:hypothetical protein
VNAGLAVLKVDENPQEVINPLGKWKMMIDLWEEK